MRRAAVCAVLAFLTVAGQLMFVDRLSLPGGSVPDLVLVVVVALGLTHGPATGMLAGFFAGLDLDLAPPASHLIGESALIFCLAGYGCGRLKDWLDHSAAPLLIVAMLAAAIGEMLQVAIAMMVGDPGVTLPAVRHVLPVTMLYDAMLTPVALAVVVLASRRSEARARSAQPIRAALARPVSPGTRIRGSAFRSGSPPLRRGHARSSGGLR